MITTKSHKEKFRGYWKQIISSDSSIMSLPTYSLKALLYHYSDAVKNLGNAPSEPSVEISTLYLFGVYEIGLYFCKSCKPSKIQMSQAAPPP